MRFEVGEPLPPRYAGFWLRLFGYIVDSIMVGILAALTLFLAMMMAAVGGALLGGPGAIVSGLVVLSAGVWIYFRLIPARLSDRGATIGMGLVGLQIIGTADGMQIGRGRAVVRCVAALGFSTVAGLLTFPARESILAWSVDQGFTTAVVEQQYGFVVSASVGYLLLYYSLNFVASGLPSLLNLTNRRRQTLHDMVTRTAVIRGRSPGGLSRSPRPGRPGTTIRGR